MNQENRLAEAFKMRNLLREFDSKVEPRPCASNIAPKVFRETVVQAARRAPPVALVGFREWIFSGKARPATLSLTMLFCCACSRLVWPALLSRCAMLRVSRA